MKAFLNFRQLWFGAVMELPIADCRLPIELKSDAACLLPVQS
jgi:hypothetical protein